MKWSEIGRAPMFAISLRLFQVGSIKQSNRIKGADTGIYEKRPSKNHVFGGLNDYLCTCVLAYFLFGETTQDHLGYYDGVSDGDVVVAVQFIPIPIEVVRCIAQDMVHNAQGIGYGDAAILVDIAVLQPNGHFRGRICAF